LKTNSPANRKIRPLPYSQFIKALLFADVYIPVYADLGKPFLAFNNSGSGYYPTGRGPTCPITNRADDDLVPAKEIRTILRHLEIPKDYFLTQAEGLEASDDNAAAANAGA
jgi:hypothetical protein